MAKSGGKSVDQVSTKGAWGAQFPVRDIASKPVKVHPQHSGLIRSESLACQRGDDSGQAVAAAADRETWVACRIFEKLYSIRYQRAIRLEHNHQAVRVCQLDGRFTLFLQVGCWDVAQSLELAWVGRKDSR